MAALGAARHGRALTEAAEHEQVLASEWGGGRSPLAVTHGKMAMWLFLISDALTFGGLLTAYLLLRRASPVWPDSGEIFSIVLITIMTTVLICSSALVAMAVAAARRGDRPALLRFLLLTILGGAAFLGMQAYEWSHFIHEGARLFANPWGVPLFSASFFVITGMHGLHVFSGVVYLAVATLRVAQRRHTAEGIEIAGLYWHFVDVVWVFVFTLFYLI